MRKLFVLAGLTSSLVGCQTFTEKGLAAGSLIGAGAGALIGSQTGNAGAGAAIGGALGGITGGMVGSGMDEVKRDNEIQLAAATAANEAQARAVTINDVIAMSQSGVAEATIIASIRNSGTCYQLSPTEIVNLHNQGVTDPVIQAMLECRPSARSAVVARPVVIAPRPVYVVEPDPWCYGPRYRHCGPAFGFHYHRCR